MPLTRRFERGLAEVPPCLPPACLESSNCWVGVGRRAVLEAPSPLVTAPRKCLRHSHFLMPKFCTSWENRTWKDDLPVGEPQMKNLARTCAWRGSRPLPPVCRASDTHSPRVAPPSEKPQPKHGSVSLGSTRVTCSKDPSHSSGTREGRAQLLWVEQNVESVLIGVSGLIVSAEETV